MYRNAITAANHALAEMSNGRPMSKGTEGWVYTAFKIFDHIEDLHKKLTSMQVEELHSLWTKVAQRAKEIQAAKAA